METPANGTRLEQLAHVVRLRAAAQAVAEKRLVDARFAVSAAERAMFSVRALAEDAWDWIKREVSGRPQPAGAVDPLTEPLPTTEPPARPRVVCLCGSTKFIDAIAVLAWELEKKGAITLKPNLLPDWYCRSNKLGHHMAEHQGVKAELDALHMRKIDLADEVVVVDLAGYVGESTRAEIAHAVAVGRPVRYLSRDEELDALLPGSWPIPGDDTKLTPGLAGMRVMYGAHCSEDLDTTPGFGNPTICRGPSIGVCFDCMGVQCSSHAGEAHVCKARPQP